MVQIFSLKEHKVRGETRWTGVAALPGASESQRVVVLPVAGRLVAIKARCPHAGADLLKGTCLGDRAIECPSHGWVIPFTRLSGYEVEVRDGAFWLTDKFTPPPEME